MSVTNTSNSPVVAVLGAGSWGSALAQLVADKGVTTRLWARSEEAARQMASSGSNERYLQGASLQSVKFSSDIEEVISGASWIVSAVPCSALPELAARLADVISPQTILVSGTKGLHPDFGKRPSEIWQASGGLSTDRIVALSGPNLAREIASGVPTSTVVASVSDTAALAAQELFSSSAFRVYTSNDLLGVELGGALKNVVAIAAGICDGLGFGDNSKAALITRAWHEMTRLATALGARQETLFGLSGMGDLIATCVSPLSRNRRLGEHLAGGETLGQAQHEVAQVAEGVHTTKAALTLAQKCGVPMPVSEQIAAVLFEGLPPSRAVAALMQRRGCSEY